MQAGVGIVALALDQSPTSTGWAVGSPDEDKPRSGIFTLPKWGDDEGARLCEFQDWMAAKIEAENVTHCFYESPADYDHKSFDVTSKQNMQIGVIHMTARRCGRLPIQQVTSNDWRKRFIGCTKPVGVTGKHVRPELKRMAMKACASG